jgi:hypothetical protein
MTPTPANGPTPNEPKRYASPRGSTTLANLVRLEVKILDKPHPIPKKRPKGRKKKHR